MGLIAKILTGKLAVKVMDKAFRERRRAPRVEYIPAAVGRRGGQLADRAGGFVSANRKMLATFGAAAAALFAAKYYMEHRQKRMY